jgi:hypothetical protein
VPFSLGSKNVWVSFWAGKTTAFFLARKISGFFFALEDYMGFFFS